MGFSDIGSESDRPVIFLHGTPSSRLEGLGFAKLAKSAGIRVLTPDRPGIGLSSLQPGRKLLDYPQDISDLAHHLGIDRMSIIGGSGGGPYAVACAFALPRERLRSVGVLAGMGQARRGAFEQLRWQNRLLLRVATGAPGLVGSILDRTLVKYAREPARLQAFLSKCIAILPKDDQRIMKENPEALKALTDMFVAHLHLGSQGFLDEARVTMDEWGFELDEVQYEGVKLWYGEEDTATPAEIGRQLAKGLKGATLRVFAGQAHFGLMMEHGDEIVQDFLRD